jgi:excinuclease ABC subunit A
MKEPLDRLDPRDFIVIIGARTNNLKNISLAFKRNSLTVITGLSGSGKSSLAFDTIYAEGRRMYIESLNAYARQFFGKIEKPAVTQIKGLAPAIAIEQKKSTNNPRSVVGTITEIYDYFKLLYARIGVTISPISNKKVTKDTVSDVTQYICSQLSGAKIMILFPFLNQKNILEALKIELAKGFTRLFVEDTIYFIEEIITTKASLPKGSNINILVDRFVIEHENEEIRSRVADSVQTAFFEGKGYCIVSIAEQGYKTFSDKLELDGMAFEEPSVNFFGFNNPYGACSTCGGFGSVIDIDNDKVIPNKKLSISEGAVAPWQTDSMRSWRNNFMLNSVKAGFPIYKAYKDLSLEHIQLLWHGDKKIKGIYDYFKHIESLKHQIQYRVLLSRYKGKTTCPDCLGSRIRKDAAYVKIGGKSIIDLMLMPIVELNEFFNTLELTTYENKVANRLVIEIKSRLKYLLKVGLGYLNLNREAPTLSGGEYQRVLLANALGSTLVGAIYILDEPTIGLHPRDTHLLAQILRSLQTRGNTVLIVEHEEEIMRMADQIVDIGPDAGSHGGEVVFQGDWNELAHFNKSHTARYLNGIEKISVPSQRRTSLKSLTFRGCTENNLKDITINIPLNTLTVITGVSGSGKSTLVEKVIYPALSSHLGQTSINYGKFDAMEGDFHDIDFVDFVSQNPIGKSSRSNPVSYIKAYDSIRTLFAKLPLAVQRGYTPGHFSYNVVGGRCEECSGEGIIVIEMQFMADISMTCEACNGHRFKEELLEISYNGKNIFEVLNLTVDDSLGFFANEPAITLKLQPLQEVGLGYLKLGQSTNTLSGGEAQRLKLAYYLGKGFSYKHVFFIFDEPTTGLHVHDINRLLRAMNALVDAGHSVLIVEHNMELIKCADYIIDLGPDSGNKGGEIVFEGTPEEMVKHTYLGFTAKYLQMKL